MFQNNESLENKYLKFRKTKLESQTPEDKKYITEINRLLADLIMLIPIENQKYVLDITDRLTDILVQYFEKYIDEFYKLGFKDGIKSITGGYTNGIE